MSEAESPSAACLAAAYGTASYRLRSAGDTGCGSAAHLAAESGTGAIHGLAEAAGNRCTLVVPPQMVTSIRRSVSAGMQSIHTAAGWAIRS